MVQVLQNGWWRCNCICGCSSERTYKLQESTTLVCGVCGAAKPDFEKMLADKNAWAEEREQARAIRRLDV